MQSKPDRHQGPLHCPPQFSHLVTKSGNLRADEAGDLKEESLYHMHFMMPKQQQQQTLCEIGREHPGS